ncbi:hypothetical protein SLNWT_2206 [Streptomyces albus]|uniref:Uncharacterized protein n=1 Tax=Streptomyces albus (strain ATCC 21838 / DSM 41398 / FERM P-419 / JCM 4703 / NBRC 107858) TaxID=1081613 RepID=A0A0B5EWT3_STRA4|nr:hypothetical protein SLNWT_2206 [Streptomyces albus]AOU76896.1 hypothetical protein SLNHY_2205 [Streptomyces albus]
MSENGEGNTGKRRTAFGATEKGEGAKGWFPLVTTCIFRQAECLWKKAL